MYPFQNLILFITILFSGLVAGLLFSYSCSVNIGLKVLPDQEYLRAMQSINIAIQNPYFLIVFMGLLLLFPLTTWNIHSSNSTTSFYFFLIATLFYYIGVFGVTALGNIPLNNQLSRLDIKSASSDKISAMRFTFETAWNKFHLIRTISSILSFGSAIVSLIQYKH